MPQRFLRPGITTSKRFNQMEWNSQSFYIRLITLVDDYGRYEADLQLLRSHCFPFGGPGGKDIPIPAIEKICQELSDAKLVEFYKDHEGKTFLQLTKWKERTRADESKYPIFDNTCEQMYAHVDKCMLPSSSSSPSSPPSPLCPAVVRKEVVPDLKMQAVLILNHLNEKSGRGFRVTDSNLNFIQGRLAEDGVEFDQVKIMVDRQCAKWKTDFKMSEFLRPETLFNKTKFDSYYSARNLPVEDAKNESNKPNHRPTPSEQRNSVIMGAGAEKTRKLCEAVAIEQRQRSEEYAKKAAARNALAAQGAGHGSYPPQDSGGGNGSGGIL